MDETLFVAEKRISSRFWLGTAQYPSLEVMRDAIVASNPGLITVSLRREAGLRMADNKFWRYVMELGVTVLPNTAGCRNAIEAVEVAKMAREVFETNWIKLEVIGDEYTLQPDMMEVLRASELLRREEFAVLPYVTEDIVFARKLIDVGCVALMPWGAPIGSGMGMNNIHGLRNLRRRFPNVPIIIDAGIGAPSHAVAAMEEGFDAVLLNTAVAKSGNPVNMARAFSGAVVAGRIGYLSGMIPVLDFAVASTPIEGIPFW